MFIRCSRWRGRNFGIAASLHRPRVTGGRLAATLRPLLESTDFAARARSIGEAVNAEDGAGIAAAHVERLAEAASAWIPGSINPRAFERR